MAEELTEEQKKEAAKKAAAEKKAAEKAAKAAKKATVKPGDNIVLTKQDAGEWPPNREVKVIAIDADGKHGKVRGLVPHGPTFRTVFKTLDLTNYKVSKGKGNA